MLDSISHDIRHAVRSLLRAPGYAIALLAGMIPARRATRVEPIFGLRND